MRHQLTVLYALLHDGFNSSCTRDPFRLANGSEVFVEHAWALEDPDERDRIQIPSTHRGHAQMLVRLPE